MKLKFLCCSDTHGEMLPALSAEGAVAWLHAGDVHNKTRRSKEAKFSEAMAAWASLNNLPVHAVRGNHDCTLQSEFFNKFNDMSGRCEELAPGLMLVGIGWAGGEYYDLPTERDMKAVCDEIRRSLLMKGKPGDRIILLSHYPPWSEKLYDIDERMAAKHAGWLFSAVTELIDEIKPMVVIQGHVHEFFGNQMVYDGPTCRTLIVSAGPNGGILNVDPELGTAEFVFSNPANGPIEQAS